LIGSALAGTADTAKTTAAIAETVRKDLTKPVMEFPNPSRFERMLPAFINLRSEFRIYG
jgi:hypothetical protein